jgi:hypothetical protein
MAGTGCEGERPMFWLIRCREHRRGRPLSPGDTLDGRGRQRKRTHDYAERLGQGPPAASPLQMTPEERSMTWRETWH